MLDVKKHIQGIINSTFDKAQRNAVSSSVTGLMMDQTDINPRLLLL
jgi:hypothetical protein